MRTRTHLLLTIVVSLVAAAVGSVAAVAVTVEPALACSIAAPSLEVRPSRDLQPGQQIEIVGWAFYDIEVNAPQPHPPENPDITRPDVVDLDLPGPWCDFSTTRLTGLDVTWHGGVNEWLGQVTGPDFVLRTTVPEGAAAGPATISVGPATAHVRVGPDVPPPPCLLAPSPDGATTICPYPDPDPDPWPCPRFEAHAGAAPPPAPGADVAPGFVPSCPDPCFDAAHTIDQAPADGYSWDCPDPCGYPQANPGAAIANQAVWCPPPEPCPVYVSPGVPVPAQADGAQNTTRAVSCPDPCGLVGGDAVWCPPPCAYSTADVDAVEVNAVDVDAAPAVAADAALAVWCPTPLPDPPAITTGAAVAPSAAAVEPVGSPTHATEPPPPAVGEPAAAAYRSMANRVLRIADVVRTLLLGSR